MRLLAVVVLAGGCRVDFAPLATPDAAMADAAFEPAALTWRLEGHSAGDGTWTPETSGVTYDLYGMVRFGGQLYVGGASGQLIVSSGDGSWLPVALPIAVTTIDALWTDGATLYAATSDGILRAMP